MTAKNDSESHTILNGVVSQGKGEGAQYMSLYETQFRQYLNLVPFPGTLNIRLDQSSAIMIQDLDVSRSILLPGFTRDGRDYGWVRCFAGALEPDIPCYYIQLEKTHHKNDIAEIISGTNIRKEAALVDGSPVTISLP